LQTAENILNSLPNNVTANISLANIKVASFNIFDSGNIRVGIKLGIEV
jgi:hypothetical protein